MGHQDLRLALGQLGKQGCRGTLASTWGMFSVLSWRAWFFLKYLSVSWIQGPQAARIMQFADASGRNRQSTKKDVPHDLDSPDTELKCTRRIHSSRKCFVGCVPQEHSEMEFNVGRFLGAALGINTYVKEGMEAQGVRRRG